MTFRDETAAGAIGRHSAEDVKEAFEAARLCRVFARRRGMKIWYNIAGGEAGDRFLWLELMVPCYFSRLRECAIEASTSDFRLLNISRFL